MTISNYFSGILSSISFEILKMKTESFSGWLGPFPYNDKASFLPGKPLSTTTFQTEHFIALQPRSAHGTRTLTSVQLCFPSAS